MGCLSSAWGVEIVEGIPGKAVWAELEIDADPFAAAPPAIPGLGPGSINFDDVEPL